MTENIIISGFADEIDPGLEVQLRVVRSLGMDHICLRAADGKGVAAYSLGEFENQILPRLNAAGVRLSSLGSPIGKIHVDDEAAFEVQLRQLETLCRMCRLSGCRYIRIFSFWMVGKESAAWEAVVLEKLRKFIAIAEKYDVVLLHENEKDIFGDNMERCALLMEKLGGPHFKAAFDPANFVQVGQDPAVCWERLRGHVAYIHIKDAAGEENVLCGTGDGKIAEILKMALREDGYRGFLTLEPHLVPFDTLQSLELGRVKTENKAKNGAQAYAMQYHALMDILEGI